MGEYHATEQDIRHTILLSIKRIDKDYVDDIKNIEQKIANKIELEEAYKKISRAESGEIYREKEMKTLLNTANKQFKKRLNILKNKHTDWIKTTNLFTPLVKAKTLTELTDFLNEDLAWFIQRGLRLLKSDFTYRRNFSRDKPDIAAPEYIEQIIDEYDKYGLHEEEYLEVTYWLNIIATKKWLTSLRLQDKEKINYELSDNNEHGERQSILQFRDDIYMRAVKAIKLIYETPEKTFLSASGERIDFYIKNKHNFMENSFNYLTWLMYKRESYTADGEPCKGLCTFDSILDIFDNIEIHFYAMLLINNTMATVDEAIKSSADRAPEEVLLWLEEMLNNSNKRALMASHSEFPDYLADWRAYNIKLFTQEIEFQKKRLAIKASGKSDGTSDNATKEEPSIGFTENMQSQNDLTGEKEVYRVASEHEPGETWPDSIFDELFEIQKRTGETNLKVSERFCENAGIIDQASALLKAWKDHNSGKRKKGTKQAQSRHDFGTI